MKARWLISAPVALAMVWSPGTGRPVFADVPPTPTVATFADPHGSSAGEPSVGFDPRTGALIYGAGLTTYRVTLGGGSPTWKKVTPPTNLVSLDAILETDRGTGRTFVSQLDGACSIASYSDDDGASWTPSQGCGLPAAPDHQTVGSGPFPASSLVPHVFADAFYYCSQGTVSALCARSDDGGLTYGPGVPVFPLLLSGCSAFHGHLKVSPDGAAYLPNAGCPGGAAVAISQDAGTTWSYSPAAPNGSANRSDPSVAAGAGNTLYMGYIDAAGHPEVAVSENHGQQWTRNFDVGSVLGIQNAEFPAMVAGDDERAALAFVGTRTAGDDQSSAFDGQWHLFIAFTYDRGAHWSTVDATPSKPMQVGCIWLGGFGGPCRNLLDFMDATIDGAGNVVVGYPDGCTRACAASPSASTSTSALSTIAVQTGGLTLLKNPSAPKAAAVAIAGETTVNQAPAASVQAAPLLGSLNPDALAPRRERFHGPRPL